MYSWLKQPEAKSFLLLWLAVLPLQFLFGLSHVTFSQDQARDIMITQQNIAERNWLVAYGPKTSVGDFTVFPFYYQIFLLTHLFVDHPLSMYVVTILLGSITPLILFALFSLVVDRPLAWSFSFLYATFVLVLTYSTSAWSPNWILFFSLLSLYAWMRLLSTPTQPKWIAVAVVSLTICIHLHFQSFMLVPFALIAIIYCLKKTKRVLPYLLLGLAISLLLFIPYGVGEWRHDWQNSKEILTFYSHQRSQYFDRVSKPEYVISYYPALFERVIFGREVSHNNLIGKLIFFGGLLTMLVLSKKSRYARWLTLYFLTLFLAVRLFKGDKLDYYLMPFFFFPALFIATIGSYLARIRFVIVGVLAFTLGFLFVKPSFNDLQQIRLHTSAVLDQIPSDQPLHLYFHDLDLANQYIYGVNRNANRVIDRSSPILVEVCQPVSECLDLHSPMCYPSEISTYASLLKHDNEFERFTAILTSPRIITYVHKRTSTEEKKSPAITNPRDERDDILADTN